MGSDSFYYDLIINSFLYSSCLLVSVSSAFRFGISSNFPPHQKIYPKQSKKFNKWPRDPSDYGHQLMTSVVGQSSGTTADAPLEGADAH
ncbi:hypothetical protein TNCV_2646901 [Trichonephila clavipes]|nr:hypothetical protein TNCV_2646901 [Trichonephila clavipes]